MGVVNTGQPVYYDSIEHANVPVLKLMSLCHNDSLRSLLSLSVSLSPSGQRGVYRTSSGLQLAYLSGSYDRRQFRGGDKRESQLVSSDSYQYCMAIVEDSCIYYYVNGHAPSSTCTNHFSISLGRWYSQQNLLRSLR